MTQLYVLANEYRAAAEKLADLDLDAETITDTLDSLSGDFEQKAIGTSMVLRNIEATAEQIKQAEAAMAARRKALENRADSIKRYLLGAMQTTGITKIECPHFRISVRDNPPAVDVFDAAQVPAEFMVAPPAPPPAPDKAAIKAAIKAGAKVPGARITQGQRVEVRA
jgi:hypothetical protein